VVLQLVHSGRTWLPFWVSWAGRVFSGQVALVDARFIMSNLSSISSNRILSNQHSGFCWAKHRPIECACRRDQAVLALTANTAWNLAHFRAPLLQAFIKRGFLLVALVPMDASVLKLQAMGCKIEPLPVSAYGRSPLADFLLFWNYLRLLRRYRPVALLSFTVKPNIYGGLAARLLGITQVGNISGLGTAFIKGGWLGRLVQELYRLGLEGAKTVFFQNPDDRGFFLARRLVREGQAALLPGSGVNLNHFRPVGVRGFGKQGPFVFLFVGRLLGDKGLMELVRAMKLLKDSDVRLIILGPDGGTNPTAIAPSVLAQWLRDPQLELPGATDDVRPFIAQADCVVLPSYREGTPRALLEAAAMGKPLIATDVPGCREVVHDGNNGYLCKVKDSADLARVMRKLMELPAEQRLEMGRASRRLAEEVFDDKIVVRKYLDALR
jgi:glycosyltransferase involved in cell wall biosynthesis